jgi:ABC-type cobalamin/Fe3+-siderophores transport system ATPase subunit
MITRLTLSNFKSVGRQAYDFTRFDLLVGRNNSGKSTVLQALAIWQYCVDEFRLAKRTGSKGIQIVLPNFTALPVPEFNLLWKDRTDRHWPLINGSKKQEYILIELIVDWIDKSGNPHSFGVALRYHSAQTIYAIPQDGWAKFVELDRHGGLPRIAYVPPFSGLEPVEKWLDKGNIREQVGKAQPGSVLRNLLLQVCPPPDRDDQGKSVKGYTPPAEWNDLQSIVERWFSVKLQAPDYRQGVDTRITVEYVQGDKRYDVIAGGSGFHQTLTLLAFLYGYRPTTILLDEPDAHLHVNLQREILDYFKRKASETGVQFLIATHAEEFAKGVDASQIVSLLKQTPSRIQSTPDVLRAMADVSNEEITRLKGSPYILYVEGQSDERILRAWAPTCGARDAMDKICFRMMDGGNKQTMKDRADAHFESLKQIVPGIKRLMLFDFDDDEQAFHPQPDNSTLVEWKRKNIENYLLVADAWRRAALNLLDFGEDDLFAQPVLTAISQFYSDQNMTLPAGKTWRNVSADIFRVVNGKRILFENNDSLFHALRQGEPAVELIRESVAAVMTADEIHEDVHRFFGKLVEMVQ